MHSIDFKSPSENAGGDDAPAVDIAGRRPVADAVGNGGAATFVSWDLSNLAGGPRHRGAIEWFDETGIGGWCIAAGDPTQPVELEVRFMDTRLAVIETGHSRPDVAAAVGCRDCSCGFRLLWSTVSLAGIRGEIDAAAAERVGAVLSVRPVGGGIELGFIPAIHASTSPVALLELLRQLVAQGDQDELPDQSSSQGGQGPLPVASPPANPHPAEADQRCRPDKVGEAKEGGVEEDGLQEAIPPRLLVDGAWLLDGRQIDGWLNPVGQEPVRLAIRCDGETIGELDVGLAPPPNASYALVAGFSYCLPQSLTDNRPHEISVVPTQEPDRLLRCMQGGTTAIYRQRIMATIDSVEGGIVQGWAVDTADPSATLEVRLWDGLRQVNSVLTRLPRKDLKEKFGTNGEHGFTIAIPAYLFDGLDHQLRLTAGDESVTFPHDLALPRRLHRALLQNKTDRYVGSVERVDASWIEGWAADLLSPFRPVRVSLLVDGVCVAIVSANQFQKRLQTITESGFHAFRYRWPSHLMNGTIRKVEVRIVEGDHPLRVGKEGGGTAREVFFPLIDFFAAHDGLAQRRDAMTLPLTNIVCRGRNPGSEQLAGSGSIIILNWNGAQILDRTLQSIARYFTSRPVEVIVVDHGSSDDSLAIIEGFKGQMNIKALARKTNFSFSSSNNLAAAIAAHDYLFFVNNDIVFTDDCLPLMADWLDRDPGVGIVGMRLVEPVPDSSGATSYCAHHRGVQFQPKVLNDEQVFYGPVELADDFVDIGAAYEMPAVTGAALLCRKADFIAIGGFDDAYFYGMEDVDLCLRLSTRLGKRVICDTSVTAIHNRSFTRTARLVSGKPNPIAVNPKSQSQNHLIYSSRFKRKIVRETLVSLVKGQTSWRPNPLRVTFAVTDASFSTPAEDFFVAMEMATAMRELFGWETLFVRHDVHELPGTDVLVVMHHDYDLAKIRNANPGLVAAAWICGQVDAWLASAQLQSYHLLFCASHLAARHVTEMTGREAFLLPVATNAQRFAPRSRDKEERTDVVFIGNYPDHGPGTANILDTTDLPGTLAIYGHGWADDPRWRRHWRGAVPYHDMPDVYSAADVVIDDCRAVPRAWNTLSPRIFDALSVGTLVVTNAEAGARDLFGDMLPTFASGEELSSLLSHHLKDGEARTALVERLRAEVLANHTYRNRASVFETMLARFVAKSLRFSIKIGVPRHDEKEAWGDWHFALGLARALTRAGHHARIDILPDWNCMQGASDDVVIVLRGLSAYKPVSSKINLLWLISHPDDVPLSELDKYDHVFVASDTYAGVLRRRLGDHVSPLLQCTDPALFHDGDEAPEGIPDLLFVGNSRGVRRQVVDDAILAGLPLGVYGGLWEGLIPPKLVLGAHLANDGLRAYYSNAKVVLNDHWPDMRREGFISNRIFDAGACGAAIVSDDVAGMAELFGDAVVTYDDTDDLARKVGDLLANDERRKALGERMRRTVLAHHTFDHRVRDILDAVRTFQ